MNNYPKSILLSILVIASIAFIVEVLNRLPSNESGLVSSQDAGPTHKSFSSPSSVVVGVVPSAAIYRVSAYCPGLCCCGKFADGVTASGVTAVGKIVAAPPEIPFGTVLKIPGYGVAAVQDRGGAITGNRLDVLFPTHEEAKQWGVQWLKVKARMDTTK